jgi:hypothetical protein
MVCCVTAGGLCVLVVIVLVCFKAVSLLNNIFIILLYMSFYTTRTFTSHYLDVLIKQSTEVKTLPIANVTKFHKCPFHISDGQSQQRLLDFVTLKYWKYAWFSPGTFHSAVSILTLTLRPYVMYDTFGISVE